MRIDSMLPSADFLEVSKEELFQRYSLARNPFTLEKEMEPILVSQIVAGRNSLSSFLGLSDLNAPLGETLTEAYRISRIVYLGCKAYKALQRGTIENEEVLGSYIDRANLALQTVSYSKETIESFASKEDLFNEFILGMEAEMVVFYLLKNDVDRFCHSLLYFSGSSLTEDIRQEGYIALLRAIHNINSSHAGSVQMNVKSYCITSAFRAIKTHLYGNDRLIKIPPDFRRKVNKFRKTYQERHLTGIEAGESNPHPSFEENFPDISNPQLVSELLNTGVIGSHDDARKLEYAINNNRSTMIRVILRGLYSQLYTFLLVYTLDFSPLLYDEVISPFLDDSSELRPVEDQAMESSLNEDVLKALESKRLSKYQVELLRLKFGLDGRDSHTNSEIASIMGVTDQAIHSLLNTALRNVYRSSAGLNLAVWYKEE